MLYGFPPQMHIICVNTMILAMHWCPTQSCRDNQPQRAWMCGYLIHLHTTAPKKIKNKINKVTAARLVMITFDSRQIIYAGGRWWHYSRHRHHFRAGKKARENLTPAAPEPGPSQLGLSISGVHCVFPSRSKSY